MELFTNTNLSQLKDLKPLVNKNVNVAGIVNDFQHLESKNGKGWGKFILEYFLDQFEFRIFGEEYLKFRHFMGGQSVHSDKTQYKGGLEKSRNREDE